MSRIIVNIPTNGILQVEKTPEINVIKDFGGRYSIPVPDGVGFDFEDLPSPYTSQDIADQLAAKLLARFPMYSNITYNFLLDAIDIDDLDTSATPAVSNFGGFPPISRFQTGRGTALPGPTGQTPTTTALLPANTNPARPGMMITNTVDITGVAPGGADEFLVWWHIYALTATDDIASDFGVYAGTNLPASRGIQEVDQEPASLQIFISHDDGVTWTGPIGRLEPTDLVTFDSDVRLAFSNGSTGQKTYVAAYAVMF